MAYQFMKTHQNWYAIKEMAGLLGVSRSAYYQWVRNGVSQRRETEDAELIRLIPGDSNTALLPLRQPAGTPGIA